MAKPVYAPISLVLPGHTTKTNRSALLQNSIPFFFLPPPTPLNGEFRKTVSPSSWNWSQATLPESALECQIPRHFSGCETLGLPVYKSWNQIQANTQLLWK